MPTHPMPLGTPMLPELPVTPTHPMHQGTQMPLTLPLTLQLPTHLDMLTNPMHLSTQMHPMLPDMHRHHRHQDTLLLLTHPSMPMLLSHPSMLKHLTHLSTPTLPSIPDTPEHLKHPSTLEPQESLALLTNKLDSPDLPVVSRRSNSREVPSPSLYLNSESPPTARPLRASSAPLSRLVREHSTAPVLASNLSMVTTVDLLATEQTAIVPATASVFNRLADSTTSPRRKASTVLKQREATDITPRSVSAASTVSRPLDLLTRDPAMADTVPADPNTARATEISPMPPNREVTVDPAKAVTVANLDLDLPAVDQLPTVENGEWQMFSSYDVDKHLRDGKLRHPIPLFSVKNEG